LLVEKLSIDVENVLNAAGTCNPSVQALGYTLVIPKNYPIDDGEIRFS